VKLVPFFVTMRCLWFGRLAMPIPIAVAGMVNRTMKTTAAQIRRLGGFLQVGPSSLKPRCSPLVLPTPVPLVPHRQRMPRRQ
jgi:hypothetical protein